MARLCFHSLAEAADLGWGYVMHVCADIVVALKWPMCLLLVLLNHQSLLFCIIKDSAICMFCGSKVFRLNSWYKSAVVLVCRLDSIAGDADCTMV